MSSENILFIVTLVVEWIFGFISKKKSVKTALIPYQNVLIGLIVAIIEWIITKDFDSALMVSGLFAGGVYDLFHNITKMDWYQKFNKSK